MGNVVLAAQAICANSLVRVILIPARKWLRPRREEGGDGRVVAKAEGCRGGGRRPAGRHPFHSALALDPETAAAAEARAPVPGILARILALMWLN